MTRNKNNRERLLLCVLIARRLAIAMELDKGNVLSEDQRVVVISDLKHAVSEFFKELDSLEFSDKLSHLKLFMQGLWNDRHIDSKRWTMTVFDACMKQINIYQQQIDIYVKKGSFKEALGLLSDLTFPQEQAARVSDGPADDRKVKAIKGKINESYQISKGMQALHMAKNPWKVAEMKLIVPSWLWIIWVRQSI